MFNRRNPFVQLLASHAGGRWIIAGLLIAGLPALVHAQSIDKQMLTQGKAINKILHDKGYKNVGVLKFQVKEGNGKLSYSTGRLNRLMATRLENALILAQDPLQPQTAIGITRDAGERSALVSKHRKVRGPSWNTVAERKKLFQDRYPLAWGKTTAKVDAFLTGWVHLDFKKKKSNITVVAIDPSDYRMRKVAEFSTPLDRNTLSDANHRYIVARRAFNNIATATQLDGEVQVPETAPGGVVNPPPVNPPPVNPPPVNPPPVNPPPVNPPPVNPNPVDQEFDKILQFIVYYDGQPQTVVPGPDGILRLPTPQKGQKLHFAVKATENIGLVLRVNGVNTLRMSNQDMPVEQHARWVLDANTPYFINGLYPTFDKVIEIRAKPEQEILDFSVLGPEAKWGKIEMDLLRPIAPGQGPNLIDPTQGQLIQAVPRGLTLAKLRGQLRKGTTKNLFVGEPGTAKQASVQRVEFVGVPVASRTIIYFDRQGAAGGGLPPGQPGLPLEPLQPLQP